jgi:hypothetical protein
MALERRSSTRETNRINLGAGIHLGKVISVMDPTFNGRLRVSLLRDQGNELGEDNQTYTVNYASPFFGHTPIEALGANNDFGDTQKSYGMWFVPPDVGVTVLCSFVDGDPGEGYWFACLPPSFANHMVPAIGGTTEVALSEDEKRKYDTKLPLPTGEINKLINGESDAPEKDAEKIKKPVHPIADRFLEQGTLEDDVRGVTTTTSRRQAPNPVFGISTPGPLDYRDQSKRTQIGTKDGGTDGFPASRLGGTQFVMDDGDDRFVRVTKASDGPRQYIDVIEGRFADENAQPTNSKGELTVPFGEYTRLRTRTGHQLLMHNSEDLIYIGNARGSAWVELTSNGKIDIYAADSISIHTENDLNIKADRDINLEAGRNINMKATAEYVSPSELHRRDGQGNAIPKIQDSNGYESGRIQIESAFNTNILIGANGRIETRSYQTAGGTAATGNLDVRVSGSTKLQQGSNLDIGTGANTTVSTGADYHRNIGNNFFYSLGGDTHTTKASGKTDFVTPTVRSGAIGATAARTADAAAAVAALHLHTALFNNPARGWPTFKYSDGSIKTIMKRVPMHEPWALHENNSPALQSARFTDREPPENVSDVSGSS